MPIDDEIRATNPVALALSGLDLVTASEGPHATAGRVPRRASERIFRATRYLQALDQENPGFGIQADLDRLVERVRAGEDLDIGGELAEIYDRVFELMEPGSGR